MPDRRQAEHQDRLAHLQDFNREAYAAGPHAPNWARALASLASKNPGTLALVGPSGISLTDSETSYRVRSQIEAAALYLSALVDAVAKSREKIAISYPASARHLPLLFAVTSVLSTAINRAGQNSPRQTAPVLLISPDLDLRSRYCDVFIKDIPLDQAYPGSRLLASGVRERLTKRSGPGAPDGVCYFLPGLALPRTLGFRPHLVILDLRCSRWAQRTEDIVPWACSLDSALVVLYSLGDADAEQALSRQRVRTFPLDHVALVGLPSQPAERRVDADWSFSRVPSFLDREHEISLVPNSSEIDRNLRECAIQLDKAINADPFDVNRAHWILTTLRQMPVPLPWYESVARDMGRSSVKRLIDQIGVRSRRKADVGPILQTVRMVLQSTYDTLYSANPRAEAIRTALRAVVDETRAKRALILTRDRVSQRALSTWLDLEAFSTSPGDVDLSVRCGATFNPQEGGAFDCALVNGSFPRRYRWIAGSAIAQRVLFVAYAQECDIITRQLGYFYGREHVQKRADNRMAALRSMPVVQGEVAKESHSIATALPQLNLKVPPLPQISRAPKPVASGTSLSDLAVLLHRVEKSNTSAEEGSKGISWEDTSEEEPSDDPQEEAKTSGSEGVSCLLVKVLSRSRGEGALYLRADVPVESVRPENPEHLARVLPANLRRGDVLPRVDERGRTTLFETIVALVDGQPSMRLATAARRQWRTALVEIGRRYRRSQTGSLFDSDPTTNVDYARLLRDLRSSGATIETEQAARCWLSGETIGPDSVGSISAVGRLSGVEVVARNAKQFDLAFRKIRGVHQGIGRRVASAIRHSFKRFADVSTDPPLADELDEHLELPISELLEHIDFAEVNAVNPSIIQVLPHRVGQLFKA